MTLIIAIILTLATLFCAGFLLARPMTYRLQGAVVFVMVITACGAALCWWALQKPQTRYSGHNSTAALGASGDIPHIKDLT